LATFARLDLEVLKGFSIFCEGFLNGSMHSVAYHLYEFGPYSLNPAERLLLRGSERLDLPPRAFDTLLALAESEGHLLEKADLMDRLWPGTAVEENNLTQAIYLLRKILQDGENGTCYIETVPKRGYRFVAPIHKIEVAANGGGVKAERSSTASNYDIDRKVAEDAALLHRPPEAAIVSAPGYRTGSKRWRWVAATVAFLALATAADIWRADAIRTAAASSPIRSIAVLPLQNLSNDQDQEYFADGMTDELITDLAQIRELKVVSKTSVMQYKNTRKPLPQIGRELGVDAVVEGSVLRSGDRVRITAQLIRAANDRHLWAHSYEGELRNVISLQAQVAEAITGEVRVSLDTRKQNQLHAARTYDPEAYDLYLRGRYVFRRRTPQALHEALGYFEQAAAKDSDFAPAYAGMADCYTLLALFGDGYRWVPDAIANARHALAFDDTLAEAHTSLAAALVLDWKWNDAEKEFQRALELNPNDVQAHHWYGNLFLGPVGRHAEAIAELRRALDLDPMSLVINADLGYAYFLDGRDDAAMQQYQKVLGMDANFLPVHYDLMVYYKNRGMYSEEINELITDETLAGRPTAAANVRRLRNDREKLFTLIAQTGGRLGETDPDLAFSPVAAAEAYLMLGRKDLALADLRKSVDVRETEAIYLKVDPSWNSVHDTRQFQEMLRKIGLQPGA
jgi:TolB-like protein/DNA-binding winged helix-turn-helix (wHTH) protein